ncbi:MAG: hypothetical protein WBM50_23210, partial [Acidimicrobiales bacterium]
MSWTSEFEPSLPRSDLDSDEPDGDRLDGDVLDELVENGFSLIDRTAGAGQATNGRGEDHHTTATTNGTGDGAGGEPHGIWTDVSAPIDIPDEGPLDPSIFDGLFADLTSDADADPGTSGHHRHQGDHDHDSGDHVAGDHDLDSGDHDLDAGDLDAGDHDHDLD